MHRRHTVICPSDRLSGHDLHKHTNLAIWAFGCFPCKQKHPATKSYIQWGLIQPPLDLSNQYFTYLIATIEQKHGICGNWQWYIVSLHTNVVYERLSVMRDYLWCKGFHGMAKFVLKIPWLPPLKYFSNVGLNHHPTLFPPPRKCRFGEILALGVDLVWTTTIPSSWIMCVETNRCIPQRYRLVYRQNLINEIRKLLFSRRW